MPTSPGVSSGSDGVFRVPDLTRSTDIKLNSRLSLYLCCRAVSSAHRTLPNVRTYSWQSRQAIIFRLAALFLEVAHLIVGRQDYVDRSLQPRAVRTEVWHLWTVMFPRRSITGRLVYGRVWRRHDGRHWIYKKF